MLLLIPYPLYLIYGLVFTAIGVAIGIQSLSGASPILSRRAMLILAAAAIAHGFSEWAILCSAIELRLGRPSAELARAVCIVLMSVGFLGFGSFGVEALFDARGRRVPAWLRAVPPVLFAALWMERIAVTHAAGVGPWHTDANTHVLVRYLLGLPCTSLAAWGLFEVGKSNVAVDHAALQRGTRRAAWAFLVYAVLVGTRVSPEVAPRLALAATPLRVVASIGVGWFLIHALVLEAARERERAAKMREEFIGVIAHDLRNPIGNVVVSAKVLEQLLERSTRSRALASTGASAALECTCRGEGPVPTKAEAQAAKAIDTIMRSTNLLARLVSDLLDAANIECRRLDLRKTAASLGTIVEGAIEASGAAREHFVRVDDAYARPIEVDVDRMTQVIVNLLSNATKYSPTGSEIKVSIEPASDGGVLSVSNEGYISPADRRRLFGRFVRTHAAVESGVPGHGLGLYIVRGLVEAHGGSIVVGETGGRGGGRVVFTVELPGTVGTVLQPMPARAQSQAS
jgi:signal transduction histidine kinase